MRIMTAAVAVMVWALNAWAVDPLSVVSIKASAKGTPLKAAETATIYVDLTIVEPYHINSNRPLEDFLIPTTLELDLPPGLKSGQPVFPEAKVKMLPFSESPMAVFEGTIRVSVDVTAESDYTGKDPVLKGTVRYQACDNRACLPPVRKPFTIAMSLQEETPAFNAPAAPEHRSQDFSDRGLLAMLFLVFLGGLALNLTPCVYPMIPITISYFGGQSQGKKGSLLAHVCLYVTGMAFTYSALGVFAAMTGSLFGTALQYPPVLGFIALIMVLLALSMFDVYELRMPSFLNRLAGSSRKGYWGTFMMGLTVGIVAAPCIGPFVLNLLAFVGNKGNLFLGLILFFTLAMGMGIPFIALAIFSGSIRKLPKSGAWMVWVRKVFGFILLGMAVFFLEPLFSNALAYHLSLALLAALGGIYLAWIDRVEGTGRGFAILRHVVALAFFVFALYSAVEGIDRSMKSITAGAGASVSAQTIHWSPYSEEMLAEASRQGKPVFIDFYADWCVPCKEMDARTFSAPEVIARSRDFVMLKVDLTSTEDPKSEALRKKYDIRGVPTLVFLNPDGSEISHLRGTGFETKEVFLRKMNEAMQLSGRENGGRAPRETGPVHG